jgi:polysaccharide export outer membrane protein
MRSRRGSVVGALVAAALLSLLDPTASRATEPAGPPGKPTGDADQLACWTPATGTDYQAAGPKYLLGAGDRLKILIYQRPDLSGEFQIRDDGTIGLPLLGPIMADGTSVETLESRVNAALATVTGRNSSTGIEVVLRRPFLVAGHVVQPGAHPFVPGTTVMRAIAMSGGLYRAPPTAGASIDASREAGKLAQTTAQMTANRIRRARLVAERESKSTFELPKQLRDGAAVGSVTEMAESESRLMQERISAHASEKESRRDAIELAKTEIEALEGQHESIKAQIALARKESDNSESLLKRGLSRRLDLFSLQRVTANLEADEREVFARIQNAKGRLVNAQRELRLLDVNRSLLLEEQIGTIDKQLAADEISAQYSRQFISELTGLPTASPEESGSLLQLQIVRQADGKPMILEASEMSALCPGDVLRVSRQLGGSAGVEGAAAPPAEPSHRLRQSGVAESPATATSHRSP